MNNITVEKLIELVETYDIESVAIVKKAYDFASFLHDGQVRQSGEPYIIHPLNVAYILAEMHADCDTLCAGLLHDTLEDTHTTKEEISLQFNHDVANLVDGVTKLAKMNFSSKEEQNLANTRKIITSITEDVRIIIIKLADRLHNMRTLQFKSEFKQKENAIETLELYAPLAYYIGAYRIKSELEDLSFQYIDPDEYKKIEEIKLKIEEESNLCLQQMLLTIKFMLENKNIPNEIKVRTKNIYGIYKHLSSGNKITDIHDLLALKVMVESTEQCYQTLGLVHSKYHPINDKFKDYICNPKTNMYQSLHTTVFAPDDRLVQTQIRTFNMDKVASFGLTTYWDINELHARYIMQYNLKRRYQFYKSLTEINKMFDDNKEFVSHVKEELLAKNIYVYTSNGMTIELPLDSTPIDLAYKISSKIGNKIIGAKVNDEVVPIDYKLQNKDRVVILTDELSSGPKEEWIDKVRTTKAKRKIIEFHNK
jgi:GTP pyrophosphokinase